MQSLRIFFALALLAVSSQLQAQAPVAAPAALQPVVVSGIRPGPGLWKVSRGDHALWILATVSPVPRSMEWYSPRSEAVLRQSKEVLGSPGMAAMIGWGSAFKVAFAMPAIMRARLLPDDQTLRDVLPPELHARWLARKAMYLGKDKDLERWRPMFAADRLYSAALASAGLQNGTGTEKRIRKLTGQNHLKYTSNTVSQAITDPRGVARSFAKAQINEVACFRSVLDRLDADVAQAARRANAWAVGDVAELTRLMRRDERDPCLEAFQETEVAQTLGLRDGLARSRNQWLASAGSALASNDVSFAALPMKEMLDSDGLLARLRAKGYEVTAPE